ncbi:MAG: hypothetical protein CMH46_00040 [Muricauda sp.]|nr:hypothetical protein [Allomuricauda sp.]MAU13911.1 hypothetical protein [Allomuricauda sp.]
MPKQQQQVTTQVTTPVRRKVIKCPDAPKKKKRKMKEIKRKMEEIKRKMEEYQQRIAKNKARMAVIKAKLEAAAEQEGDQWTTQGLKKIISSTPDHMMLKAKDHDEIVKFISRSITTEKKLRKVKINAQGYAIPYLVRDIIVQYLIHHCGTNDCRGKTPSYWMNIIAYAFTKIPIKFWDVDEEEVMKFRLVCDDEDGRLKTKVENKEQLSKEEQVLLHSYSIFWNYSLPSGWGVFMLGYGIDFVSPINDILSPWGVLVYCSNAAFRYGSEYELVCGYKNQLDRLV